MEVLRTCPGVITITSDLDRLSRARLLPRHLVEPPDSLTRDDLSARLIAASAATATTKCPSLPYRLTPAISLEDVQVHFSTPLERGTVTHKKSFYENAAVLGGLRDAYKSVDKLPIAAKVSRSS